MKEIDLEGFVETPIEGLFTKPLKEIPDFRGSFIKLSLNSPFVEQDVAISHHHTLRGLHYVTEGYRIFTPIFGRAYCVFLDLQEGSDTMYHWFPSTIGDGNKQRFLIPPYVACAYLVLSSTFIVHYELEFGYDESKQRTIRFDDEKYGIYFPGNHKNFIISERDFYVREDLIR
jgi:dTDP-4-dehydrorhamnose 3,5-epimerase-like enzyme